MTNKDYKPLTASGYTDLQLLQEYRDRLCYLEDCIKNGTLVFLPCKVGDNFWWISGRYPNTWTICKEEVRTIEIDEQDVSIIDMDYTRWYLSEVYFTKEAAEKALKELK